MLGIIIAFIAGIMIGVFTMCCCQLAGQADRELEKLQCSNDTSIKEKSTF